MWMTATCYGRDCIHLTHTIPELIVDFRTGIWKALGNTKGMRVFQVVPLALDLLSLLQLTLLKCSSRNPTLRHS